MELISLALGLLAFLTLTSAQPDPFNTTTACKALSLLLPSLVFLPNTPAYKAENDAYYALQATQLMPACRVAPTKAEEVAKALEVVRESKVKFAVKSGGHMQWAGAANIGSNGVTIDLSNLNSISLIDGAAGKVAVVGTGAHWGDVYSFLDQRNLTVAGGRSTDVGVGGTLLGGGVSFLASRVGFSCDTVLQYEVLLSSGALINSTSTQHASLFRALKGGGNNFGIVTRFYLQTYPTPQTGIWGGTVMYPGLPALITAQLTALHDFGTHAGKGEDDDAAIIQSYVRIPALNVSIINNFLSHTGGKANPHILSNFTGNQRNQPPIEESTGVSSVSALAAGLMHGVTRGHVQLEAMVTFKNDLGTLVEAKRLFDAAFERHYGIKGLTLAFIPHAVHKRVLQGHGQNVLGLQGGKDDLIFCEINLWWDDNLPLYYWTLVSATQEWIKGVNSFAKKSGNGNNFVYLNYALETQDPISGYGADNKDFLRATSLKYDTEHLFQRSLPGGFKLHL